MHVFIGLPLNSPLIPEKFSMKNEHGLITAMPEHVLAALLGRE
jgi:hypothetical protein